MVRSDQRPVGREHPQPRAQDRPQEYAPATESSSDLRDGTLQRGVRPLTSTSPPNSASSQMLQMLNAFLTVQALHVAAALGIADRLADGPHSVDELARITHAQGSSLYRLLRMPAGAGSLAGEVDGRFTVTPLGMTLRSDGPDS